MSYYTTYNREGEKVAIMSKEDEKDCFLSLAYRELIELPRECIARLEHVQHLDLSNNKFSDLRSLYGLSGLTSLVLDCNEITSHTVFPSIPNLRVLWLNKNKIANLSIFIESLALLFPSLRQLCMMNNPAAPSYFNGGSKQEYLDYRQYVISHLPKLEILDDTLVTREEREKALKTYGRRRVTNSNSTLQRGGSVREPASSSTFKKQQRSASMTKVDSHREIRRTKT